MFVLTVSAPAQQRRLDAKTNVAEDVLPMLTVKYIRKSLKMKEAGTECAGLYKVDVPSC